MADIGTVKRIIMHCSASPDHQDIGFAEINAWHSKRFSGARLSHNHIIYCGYHFIIRRDGTVEVGRPENVKGAHVGGHNTGSIGICWSGTDEMEYLQKHYLTLLVINTCKKYGLTSKDVHGHNEFTDMKTCPNFNSEKTFPSMYDFRAAVAEGLGEPKTEV